MTKLIQATGKKKRAIITILVTSGTGKIIINNKSYDDYFSSKADYKNKILAPFKLTTSLNKFDVKAKAIGGGISAQMDALINAISKSLVKIDDSNHSVLKKASLLTRDSRIKERKKYGLKKARKAPQFSKR